EKTIADVLVGGSRKRVYVDPEIDKDQLQIGAPVVTSSETGAVVDVLGYPEDSGQVMKLERYLSDYTVVVKDDHGASAVAYVSVWVNSQEAIPGSKVTVSNGFVWGVVESASERSNIETSQYLM